MLNRMEELWFKKSYEWRKGSTVNFDQMYKKYSQENNNPMPIGLFIAELIDWTHLEYEGREFKDLTLR